jgi:glycosyltransferase involved in cell wall biosynthesis
MKVLHLIETLELGGTELSLLQILPRLRTSRPVLCHVFRGNALEQDFRSAGVPVVSLEISNEIPYPLRFAAAVNRFVRIVHHEQPELIVTSLFTANLIGRVTGRRLKIPVLSCFVSESYAEIRWETLSPAGRLKLWGFRSLDRLSARWASHFIANSEAVRESESRSLRVPLKKITVIHRGRDPDLFARGMSDNEAAELRSSMGITANDPIVLNVGRLVESKGQEELIVAFQKVLSTLPAAKLLIAGEGPHRAALERRVASLGLSGAVRILGRRDDVPQLLCLASVFAFPSRYEGHPGAVIEAMFAGKPLVVSDIPVHRETVENGVCGVTVPVDSPDGLAAGILSLLVDGEAGRAMGACARKTAWSRFHIDNIARCHDLLYRQIVAAGSIS